VLAVAAPPAHAGGRFFISFSFGFGGGYARCYQPYTYYGPAFGYGYYRPVPHYVAYYPRYYAPIRAYTLYARPPRVVTVYRNGRRDAERSRVYTHYVPRRYERRR
jgi:hypothetical protein